MALLPGVYSSLFAARAAAAEALGREEAARPFDLAAGPLLRTTLLRLAGALGTSVGELTTRADRLRG